MKWSIICIGNRIVEDDAYGPAVYDYLEKLEISDDIEIVDGGTGGLNLLQFIEGRDRIVFVDRISGYTEKGEITVLHWLEVVESVPDSFYGHDLGLAALLTVLPKVCDGQLPEEMVLVGCESGWDSVTVERGAKLSLEIAASSDFSVYCKKRGSQEVG